MKSHTIWSAYLFVYKQRLKKIIKQYQLAFAILIDWITLIYMIPFFLGGVILLKEFIHSNTGYLSYINTHNFSITIMFSSLFYLFYVLKSSVDPRYKITSSDFNLSLLTYDLEHVLKVVICHQQLKRMIIFALLSMASWLLGLVSFKTMSLFIISFTFIDWFSGLVQWKLFQKNLTGMIGHILYTTLFTIVLLLVYVNYLKQYAFLVLLVLHLIILLFSFLTFRKELSLQVNWNQVITIGDDKTWNLLIVKLITGVGFDTITNRYWQTRLEKKQVRQLPYDLSSIISAYWKQHFLLNKSGPFNVLGNGIAVLIFLSINSTFPIGVHFAIPTLIAIYLLYGIFNSQLDSIQFRVIPVRGGMHVEGYYRVTKWFIVILLFPHFLFLLNGSPLSLGEIGLLVISEWLLASLVYKAILHMAIATYSKVKRYTKGHHLLLILLYLMFYAFVGNSPYISVLTVMIFLFMAIPKLKNNSRNWGIPFRKEHN